MSRGRGRRLTLLQRVVLVASAASMAGFVAAGWWILRVDARQTRAALLEELTLIGASIANDARSAMFFDDRDSAAEALAALRDHPELLGATIVSESGRTFATLPPALGPDWRPAGHGEHWASVEIPIEVDGTRLGAVLIEVGEARLADRRRAFAAGLAAAVLVGLAVSLLAAFPLYRLIARPLRELAADADRLRRSAGRIAPAVGDQADDELGRLTEAMSRLLEDLGQREDALREATRRAESEARRAVEHAAETERASDAVRGEIAKRRSLQEQLRHSQRMELLGQMAGGVAHDVNNALTVIVGWVDIARASDRAPDALAPILTAAEQASRVTRQLLAFSRKEVANAEPVDANATVRLVVELAGPIVGESIELRTVLDPSSPHLLADAGQLEQVLMNFVVNARDAMPDGGTITLRTTARRAPDAETAAAFEIDPDSSYTEIAVVDDGPGVPAELRERIFEPFFTTKEIGRGTGLGLSVCYGIARSHGGALVLDDTPDGGSTFRLHLPACEPRAAAAAVGDRHLQRSVGGGRLLVVEDEPALRAILVEALRADGHEVRQAADGVEALEVVEREGETIDLVVSDMRMPRMGGAALRLEVARRRPSLPFLLISGHHEEQLRELGEPGSLRFLAKPFRPAALRAIVGEMLRETVTEV